MGAPQTPPLKTHLMSFTSKGAIFREVKISKIRARLSTLNLAFSNSISGLYRLEGSVRPGSGPPKSTPCQPSGPRMLIMQTREHGRVFGHPQEAGDGQMADARRESESHEEMRLIYGTTVHSAACHALAICTHATPHTLTNCCNARRTPTSCPWRVRRHCASMI